MRSREANRTGRRPGRRHLLFAALLRDYLRVLGPDHPDTLTTRNNLAGWTGDAGGDAAAEREGRCDQ